MKEISFNFSLTDFLAYFFPGIILVFGGVVFFKIIFFQPLTINVDVSLTTGLILAASAYFVGTINASLTPIIEKKINRFFGLSSPLLTIQLDGFENDVQTAFDEIFGTRNFWSMDHFFITRALIQENMPKCAESSNRQSALRQARLNSLIPVLFYGLIGVTQGAKFLWIYGFKDTMTFWGIGFILISIFGSYIVIRQLVIRLGENRKREVREVYAGLLSFYYQSKYEKKLEKKTVRESLLTFRRKQ